MARAARLLDLLQLLRQHRFPVSGQVLAAELGISLRTLYRDIATLQAQGAEISGEAGLGYVLKPGFVLPPLMFDQDELDAVLLGLSWVAERTDPALQSAARQALAKISAVLPPERRPLPGQAVQLVGPVPLAPESNTLLAQLRQAIRRQQVLEIHYLDLQQIPSRRAIWPLAIGYFEQVRVLVAWCELRQSFRHFRTDRISHCEPSGARYAGSRAQLLQAWRAQEGIARSVATADIF
ncbi:YafY family protein [Chitinibacter sp. ZOR0017]|uniref:helix-turn-helix transcriptional regulator n=1 Tax=Chitinibacter sp. ZOR0017 TaxID=1339254 RepID=UPI0006461128|nr:YafY family protein [Chitinibacter sp. ZOR0017]